MNTYKTAEAARIIEVHPNTVRLYEEWKRIPKPARLVNGGAPCISCPEKTQDRKALFNKKTGGG